MNDRDVVHDVLAMEKLIAGEFNTLAREASNSRLYGESIRILNETHDAARRLFGVMFKAGWYEVAPADADAVAQAAAQFHNFEQQQGPYL